MDIYKEGHKYRIARDFPDVDLKEAPEYCYECLLQRREGLVERFERLQGIEPQESILIP